MEATHRSKVHSTQLGSDCQRPVPMGVPVKAPTERGYGIELKILEVNRGIHAQKVATSIGLETERLSDGMAYLIVKIQLGYYCKAKGSPDLHAAYRVSADSFQTASLDGTARYEALELGPAFKQGLIGRSVPVGEAVEGSVAFIVPKEEREPLLVFHRRQGHSDFVLTNTWQPFWFRLSAADPMQLDGSCAECRP